jgi:putative SOS response-associated peptidase YedK
MYIFLKDQKPFVFAGLWDTWTAPDGKKVATCTIITTEPNTFMKRIHNRMPVILPKHHIDTWLDRSIDNEQEVLPLLKPYPEKEMDAYEVSRFVNSPKNNSPECIEPA